MPDAPVLFTLKGHVAQITINRPENRNSMDEEVLPAFQEAMKRATDMPDLRCLIITGSGKSFCAGADFRSNFFTEKDYLPHERLLQAYKPFLEIQNAPFPTIAAMNGHAIGGGFGLALVCDIRVAAHEAKFGANFAKLGLHTGMSISYILPRLIGLPRANELLFTGRLVNGQRAEEIGLVNYSAPADEVLNVAWDLAREIESSAPLAVRMIKRSVQRGLAWDTFAAAEVEAFCQSRSSETEDAREGVTALLEKRAPVFKGR